MAAWSGRSGNGPGGMAGQQQKGYQALTPREHQVLEYIASGRPNKVVAIDLGISMRTVEKHRARIFDKLGVRNAVELVRCWYARAGDGDTEWRRPEWGGTTGGEPGAGLMLQQPLASYKVEPKQYYPQIFRVGYAQGCAQSVRAVPPVLGDVAQVSAGAVNASARRGTFLHQSLDGSVPAGPPVVYCPRCGSMFATSCHRPETGVPEQGE